MTEKQNTWEVKTLSSPIVLKTKEKKKRSVCFSVKKKSALGLSVFFCLFKYCTHFK